MSRVPTNTTREVKDNPFLGLAIAMSPNGIEREESIGQSSFVHSETLPSDLCYGAKEALQALGVTFGEPVDGDPMFTHVTLPDGWKKVATDHSMWSDLLNEKGEKAASIFYKAAFYDRRAFLLMERKD